VTSFAQVSDLTDRGATLTVTNSVAQAILDDAAEHLQDIIGPVISPPRQSSVSLWIGQGAQWVRVPMRPLGSIDAVTLDGTAIDYRRVGDSIRVCGPGELVIQATHGYSTIPADLVSWTCVIASQVLAMLGELGSLGAGEVSSVGVDDYRKSFKQVADRGAFAIPEQAAERLAARYGGGAATTGVLR
jgi:hypothetical protein